MDFFIIDEMDFKNILLGVLHSHQ